ncbi:MAG: hypothetical protein ACRYGI_15755 [Janthinobacterium lividum]
MIGAPADWTSTPLDGDVRLVVDRAAPILSVELEAEIAAFWTEQCALRPSLFNGRVFCADRITASEIGGHWTEYRRTFAQLLRPSLFPLLSIRALAVNGLLECADGLVLGRRQPDSVYLPGCWQAAPAGNVEARDGVDGGLDLTDQLFAELEEELGLTHDDIDMVRPVAAIEHGVSHVIDVGFLLRTKLDFIQVGQRHAEAGNNEYDVLKLVPRAEIDRFVTLAGPTLMPSARILLTCL